MRSPTLPLARLALIPLALAAFTGCDDGKKLSEKEATEETARLTFVVQEDVEQVRKGLPAGAAKLATLLDPDTLGNTQALQKAISTARASVKELDVAKSTFFSVTDASGVVLRSEADPDVLAGKSVVAAFPALKKALDPAGGEVEAFGEMVEMRGLKTGQDLAWVVATPMKDDKGPKGMFVTGWSFRKYAAYLDDKAKRHLSDAAQKDGKTKIPIAYAFIVKGGKAYGSPLLSADVNAQAIEGLGVVEKTAQGPYHSNIEVTGRSFGIAAARTPELGDDAVLVVLLSEI
jgi:hypothetical protein